MAMTMLWRGETPDKVWIRGKGWVSRESSPLRFKDQQGEAPPSAETAPAGDGDGSH